MNIIIYSSILLRSNIIVSEEGINVDGVENQSPSLDEQTIASIGASLAPPLKHPNGYVRGEVSNGMAFTITLNEKGQVLKMMKWGEHGETYFIVKH